MLRGTRPPTLDPEAKNTWRQAGSASAVGIEIAVAIAIGYFGGTYLDRWLGTTPWLTWLGFGVGVGAAVKALVRVTKQYTRASGGSKKPSAGLPQEKPPPQDDSK